MEMKLQELELTHAESNLQRVNGLFAREGYRCSAIELKAINGYARQIIKLLENRENDQ